jgi:hypothetical protein
MKNVIIATVIGFGVMVSGSAMAGEPVCRELPKTQHTTEGGFCISDDVSLIIGKWKGPVKSVYGFFVPWLRNAVEAESGLSCSHKCSYSSAGASCAFVCR